MSTGSRRGEGTNDKDKKENRRKRRQKNTRAKERFVTGRFVEGGDVVGHGVSGLLPVAGPFLVIPHPWVITPFPDMKT